MGPTERKQSIGDGKKASHSEESECGEESVCGEGNTFRWDPYVAGGKEAILSEARYKEYLDRQEINRITFSAQL
jgi:hypothetical protein